MFAGRFRRRQFNLSVSGTESAYQREHDAENTKEVNGMYRCARPEHADEDMRLCGCPLLNPDLDWGNCLDDRNSCEDCEWYRDDEE